MRRNPLLVAAWTLIAAAMIVLLGLEVSASDWWRVFGLTVALVCFVLVRDDLTRSEP